MLKRFEAVPAGLHDDLTGSRRYQSMEPAVTVCGLAPVSDVHTRMAVVNA